MKFIYSPKYFADYGPHVFPTEKFRLVADALRHQGIPSTVFVEPVPATREQLLQVHTERYLRDLDRCRHTARTIPSEIPLTKEIVELFVLSCGGTINTAELALDDGAAVHIRGGFHHAFAGKAEGFCYLNDLAVANGIRLHCDDAVLDHLAHNVANARTLRATIKNQLEPLICALLSQGVDRIYLGLRDGRYVTR